MSSFFFNRFITHGYRCGWSSGISKTPRISCPRGDETIPISGFEWGRWNIHVYNDDDLQEEDEEQGRGRRRRELQLMPRTRH